MWTWKSASPAGRARINVPKKVDSEYDAATGKRKAIYVKYAQAVPLKYQIDADACIRLQKPGACGFCEKVCDAGAINFADTEKIHQLNVGAVVLAPGFEAYDPTDAGCLGIWCVSQCHHLPAAGEISFRIRTDRRSSDSPLGQKAGEQGCLSAMHRIKR